MKFSLRELDLWLLPKVRFLRSLPLVLCFTGDTKLWRLPNESEGSLRPRTFRLDLEEREKIISQNCVCSCFTSQIYYSCVMSHTLVDICFSRIEKLKFVTTEGTPFFLVGDENTDYRSSISPSSLILQSLLSYFQYHAR